VTGCASALPFHIKPEEFAFLQTINKIMKQTKTKKMKGFTLVELLVVIAIIEQLESEGFDNLPPGTDANAYLAQLITTEIIDSETYFFASGVKGAVKGDDITGTSDKLLARGENGFSYIMTEDEEALSDVKTITPLVIAPIKRVGDNPTFDGNPYADQFVYGAVDGSGKLGKIGKEGQAMSKGRDSLFQTGTDSLFGDEIPVIKAPTGIN